MTRIGGNPETVVGRYCYRYAVAKLHKVMRSYYRNDGFDNPVGAPVLVKVGDGCFWPAGRPA